MDYPPLRLRLHPSHPAIGAGYRLLNGDERIAPGDETARVSLLLSVEHPEGWVSVEEHTVGMTVTESLIGDMDANERVTRREVLRSLDMKDILNAWGHNPRYDEQGNVTAVYWVWEGEDEELFTLLYTAIAPFVRAGSVQESRDDYGNIWRWYFNGTRAVRQTGRVVYEDDPEDATPSDGGRPWAT